MRFLKRNLGKYSSLLALFSALLLALSILLSIFFQFNFLGNAGKYFSSVLLGLCLVTMVYSYLCLASSEDRPSVVFSLIISIIYFLFVFIGYHTLFSERIILSDPDHFDLFYIFSIFGYVPVSFAFIFIGLSLKTKNPGAKILQKLMYFHFIFGLVFILNLISTFFFPVYSLIDNFRLFILVFWCFYFSVLSLLSYRYFCYN